MLHAERGLHGLLQTSARSWLPLQLRPPQLQRQPLLVETRSRRSHCRKRQWARLSRAPMLVFLLPSLFPQSPSMLLMVWC